jgi:SnoaL-like domain
MRRIEMTTGRRIVDAFMDGDSATIADLLAPEATFHSPVTDYRGSRRVAKVLAALSRVVTDARPTRILDGPRETAAFFTASAEGRQAEGVLLVLADGDGLATDLTLMIRPLEALLGGVERMKEILAG